MSGSSVALALLPVVMAAGLLLAAAGALKVARPGAAQVSVAAAGLRLPGAAVRALGAGEAALGLLVVLRPSAATALAAALAYGCFALFVTRLLRRGARDGGCGCFGGAGDDATRYHAWLNALLAAVCGLAALAPPPGPAWIAHRPPLEAAALALGVGALAYAGYLAFSAVPRAWRSYAAGDPS